jgi:hypothetical protein
MKNDSPKSWLKIAYGVVLIGLASIFILICLYGATMVACDYERSATRKVFDTIHVGDTKESVISKMGTPSHIETSDAVYRDIYEKKCQGGCAERLWWEHRICLDEAWIVELDKDNKVSAVDGIFSP